MTITINNSPSLIGNVQFKATTGSNPIGLTAPPGTTSYNLTLPDNQGAASQVMINDGAGLLSWGDLSSLTTIQEGGNNFGAPVVIGSLDDYGLDFITNNITAFSISNSGVLNITGNASSPELSFGSVGGNSILYSEPSTFFGLSDSWNTLEFLQTGVNTPGYEFHSYEDTSNIYIIPGYFEGTPQDGAVTWALGAGGSGINYFPDQIWSDNTFNLNGDFIQYESFGITAGLGPSTINGTLSCGLSLMTYYTFEPYSITLDIDGGGNPFVNFGANIGNFILFTQPTNFGGATDSWQILNFLSTGLNAPGFQFNSYDSDSSLLMLPGYKDTIATSHYFTWKLAGGGTHYFSNSLEVGQFLSVDGGIGANSVLTCNDSFIANKAQFVNRTGTAINYSVVGTDYIIGITNTSSARTITLPAASSHTKQIYSIKDESGGAATNNITVNVSGGSNIDGSSSYIINTNWGFANFYSSGSQWFTY